MKAKHLYFERKQFLTRVRLEWRKFSWICCNRYNKKGAIRF